MGESASPWRPALGTFARRAPTRASRAGGGSRPQRLAPAQGLGLEDVRARLRLPAFVTAAHDVVRGASEALPPLRGLGREALAARLAAAAAGLRFAERCTTRIHRRDGGDVGLPGEAQQASRSSCCPQKEAEAQPSCHEHMAVACALQTINPKPRALGAWPATVYI